MAWMLNIKEDLRGKKQLAEALNALYMLSDKPLKEIMREQGRLLAVDLAMWTHVVGNKPVIGKMQKAAIERSIQRSYKSTKKVMGAVAKKGGRKAADRFKKYLMAKNVSKAQSMIDEMGVRVSDNPWGNRPIKLMMFDGGIVHYKRRSSRLMNAPSINYAVLDYHRVVEFIIREEKKAGQLKAGWAEAAKDLGGTRGIPAYARAKNHKTKGAGKIKGNKNSCVVTVANMANYAESSTVDHKKALSLRHDNIEKVMERMLKRNTIAITRSQRKSARSAKSAAQLIKQAMK